MPPSTETMVRSVVFHVDVAKWPREIISLISRYRLMVNQAIRVGLATGLTSRASLTSLAYADLSKQHKGLSTYVVQAINDATSILHAHRKRHRRGQRSKPPFVKRLFLKATPSCFHLDTDSGRLRLSVGNGSWVMFTLPLSNWHRAQLDDPTSRVALLTMKEGLLILSLSKRAPEPYKPVSVIALDTNEESLDGLFAAGEYSNLVRAPFGDLRTVQSRHFVRRRRIASKKANDRRLMRVLTAREGTRERQRVKSRLHLISKKLVSASKERKAAIVLEDLKGIKLIHSAKLNRRLSAWPHRELHRQITYKAQANGVPVILVNPYMTSQKCAMCGWTPKRSKTRTSARKAGGMYACGNPNCLWRINRQFNAGINILRTALTERPGLGGVRFHLDALSRDVMNPLYGPASRAARGERMERESQKSAFVAKAASAFAATGP